MLANNLPLHQNMSYLIELMENLSLAKRHNSLSLTYQEIQSVGCNHAINLLTSGLFTINVMWSYWNVNN